MGIFTTAKHHSRIGKPIPFGRRALTPSPRYSYISASIDNSRPRLLPSTTPANHLPRSKSITMATSLFRTAPALRAGLRASTAKPIAGMASTTFVRGKATLPDLPYDYGALEPHISGQIMELHHSKHHQTYVNGLNSAVEAIGEAKAKGDDAAAAAQAPLLNFHGGGHLNHSLFWENLAPNGKGGGGAPEGKLLTAIRKT